MAKIFDPQTGTFIPYIAEEWNMPQTRHVPVSTHQGILTPSQRALRDAKRRRHDQNKIRRAAENAARTSRGKSK